MNPSPTLAVVVAEVAAAHAVAVRPGSMQTYTHQWAVWVELFGADLPVAALDRARCQQAVATLAARYAPTTLRCLLNALRIIIGHAIEAGLLAEDPLRRITAPRPVRRVRAWLSRAERDRLLMAAAGAGRDLHLLVALGLLAGLRKSEALGLTWGQVDLTGRQVRIANHAGFTTKSGHWRSVPMCAMLADVLVGYAASRDPTVFVLAPDHQLRRGRYRWHCDRPLAALGRRVGLPRVTPHLLRHSFASIVAQEGVSLYKLALWLGHGAAAVTELYLHAAPGFDPDIERLNAAPTPR